MDRIAAVFKRTKSENRTAIIPFIMGYDGGRDTTESIMDELVAGGADIIEVGVPFSDPMADGAVIQAAGLRALQAGASLAGILEMIKEFRKKNGHTPVVLMGYYNPVYRYGVEKFCKDAGNCGVDGVIVVDLPPEEEDELAPFLRTNSVDFIRLIAPTSKEDRLEMLTKTAGGFIYYIAVAGITGGKSADPEELRARLAEIREHTDLPVAVGFGIKTASQAASLKGIADAVVIGSALVDLIHKSNYDSESARHFIEEIKSVV